jgi:hypothetical protein
MGFSLPIIYYLLSIIYYLLPITYHLLPIIYSSLLSITRCKDLLLKAGKVK